MAMRELRDEESLENVWEELIYTEARRVHDPHAKDLVPVVSKLAARRSQVREGQEAAWRAEVVAQAGVDGADDTLDEIVSRISVTLLHAVGDRTSPRFTRYFKNAPNIIIRMGLASEIEVVRGWPESLKGEAEKELKILGKDLADAIAVGDAALEERRRAAAARADHRVREIIPLIEDINAARLSLYAELTLRSGKHRLPRDWADRFFRRGARVARGRTVSVEPPLSPEATRPS